MPRQKLYSTDRERKDARNLRLKNRRSTDITYNRYTGLRNNYSIHVAKHFSEINYCQCCGYKRDHYYPEIHHIIEKKDGGKDIVSNCICLCFACHQDIHLRGHQYLESTFPNFNLESYKKTVEHLNDEEPKYTKLIILEYQGQEKTIKEWAEITGIGYRTILSRRNLGWSVDRILEKNK